ncbi:hypothetical protein DXB04_18060 [Enterocloster bolteae]|jgi:hypothetical protein|uniref:Uncharacterized protein n=1 Tax=Enterocloster bolteae TaxID=208479 RepID=A0A414AWX9_9FIRM|nr:hypothetical protein DXC96_00050 [Enterocloster bolteae]RGO83229.1 hypothetical protein DXB04_18060 [Enterocloster bolteae]RHC56478.1 hypothetical protein DW839_09025 [Enterocloster bolteae]
MKTGSKDQKQKNQKQRPEAKTRSKNRSVIINIKNGSQNGKGPAMQNAWQALFRAHISFGL